MLHCEIVLHCIVVGSRRLMPPDVLQPKAYCTNPGLQSFLLTPPGVSTREPSSERRNYLGEKWPVIWTESCDFHAYTFGFFCMPQICDMGQAALLPFRRKARWGFFRPEKSDLGTKGQHAISRSPKPLCTQDTMNYIKIIIILCPNFTSRLRYWCLHYIP